jgi:predicted RNase H-like HicB family nuclease
MKYVTASIALAAAALLTGHAQAADNIGKTREQVRAELAEAQRTGDIFASKDAGDEFGSGGIKKLNELNPAAYPAKVSEAGKTRAQVLAELAEAQRTGNILASKDAGDEFGSGGLKKLNELNPAAYPAKVSEAGKTRAQVLAELAEAQRTGDIVASKDAGDEFGASNGRKLNEIYPNLYPQTRVN